MVLINFPGASLKRPLDVFTARYAAAGVLAHRDHTVTVYKFLNNCCGRPSESSEGAYVASRGVFSIPLIS